MGHTGGRILITPPLKLNLLSEGRVRSMYYTLLGIINMLLKLRGELEDNGDRYALELAIKQIHVVAQHEDDAELQSYFEDV